MPEPPPEHPLRDDEKRSFGASEAAVAAVETLIGETADAVTDQEKFDVGELFEALSDPGRRYVLTYLLQSEGSIACTELVDYVVERTDTGMTESEFRRRVVTELTHSHLPKLESMGLVTYNMERQLVGPTDLTPIVRPYLQLALRHQALAESTEESG
jgi:DNA-binding transcriptional ArsR family regulator